MLTITKRSQVIIVREVMLTMVKKVTSNKADREVMLTMTKRSPVIRQTEK